MKKFLLVSLGIFYKFVDGKPHVFLQKRDVEGALKGKWEFPGGKIEIGESPVDAVIRELKEEVNIDLKSEDVALFKMAQHEYPETNVILYSYVIKKSVELENWFPVDLNADFMNNVPEANHEIFKDLEKFFGNDETKFKNFETSLWSIS